jgi:hypothetical protein
MQEITVKDGAQLLRGQGRPDGPTLVRSNASAPGRDGRIVGLAGVGGNDGGSENIEPRAGAEGCEPRMNVPHADGLSKKNMSTWRKLSFRWMQPMR